MTDRNWDDKNIESGDRITASEWVKHIIDHESLTTHTNDTSNPHNVTNAQVGLTNVTDDAQLKRAAADINSFVEKISPVGTDIVIIEDSAASYAKKKVQVGNLPIDGGAF